MGVNNVACMAINSCGGNEYVGFKDGGWPAASFVQAARHQACDSQRKQRSACLYDRCSIFIRHRLCNCYVADPHLLARCVVSSGSSRTDAPFRSQGMQEADALQSLIRAAPWSIEGLF